MADVKILEDSLTYVLRTKTGDFGITLPLERYRKDGVFDFDTFFSDIRDSIAAFEFQARHPEMFPDNEEYGLV